MLLLLAVAMLAMMLVAGPTLAAPGGHFKNNGDQIRGGHVVNENNGQTEPSRGGQLNNLHL
jgi:hypothetical protein